MSDAPRDQEQAVGPGGEDLSNERLEQAVGVIMGFCALDQVGRLYDMNNELVQRVLRDMHAKVEELGAGGDQVILTLSGYSFFLNHQLVRMDFSHYQKAQQLKKLWHRLGIDEVSFPPDLTLEGLTEFSGKVMDRLNDPGTADSLFENAWGGITVREVVGDDEAGKDALPVHEVAARIYCVLVTLTEQLIRRLKAGEPTPVLQIKQAVQAAVDHMEVYEGMLISLSRCGAVRPSLAAHQVNTAMLVLTLGMRLGLQRSDLMALAVAAIVHDLPKVGLKAATLNSLEHPERATPEDKAKVAAHWLNSVRNLISTGNLSEDAMGRLVVLFESQLEFTRRDLYGKDKGGDHSAISSLGRLISVCDAFDTLTWQRPEKKALAPHLAVMHMLEKQSDRFGLPMLKLFLETVGAYPSGSAVHLESGEVALVTRQNLGLPDRPVVRVVLSPENQPVTGPEVDLKEEADKKILAHADPDKIGLNLAGCLGL